MNLAPVQVILYRDGAFTPWGFRLQGGSDLGVPLTIQRVTMGSPSEGELHRFDIISRIGNHDATRMTHQQAQSAIKSVGNPLNLTVLRSSQNYPAQNSFGNQPSYYSVSPLPTTDFNDFSKRFVPGPAQNNPSAHNAEGIMEREIERHSIVSQPHRTFPLITPSLKLKHDLPTGSYLRHVSDPFAKSRENSHNSMKARVQESVLNAGAAYSAGSLSPARSATPEVFGQVGPNSGIVHRQYNSPIHLYSQQNVMDTISGQTGVTPNLGDLISTAVREISNSPDISARKGADPLRFFDITQSPTYQAIYEQEWKTLRNEKLDEHKPVQNQVKVTPKPPPVSNQQGHNHVHPGQPHHHHHNHGPVVNPFGTPKDKVLQSKSFELIKNVLAGQTDF